MWVCVCLCLCCVLCTLTIVSRCMQDADEDDETQILNVSFSVRLMDTQILDLDSFYSPQFLQERIYLSRTILTKATGLEVYFICDAPVINK